MRSVRCASLTSGHYGGASAEGAAACRAEGGRHNREASRDRRQIPQRHQQSEGAVDNLVRQRTGGPPRRLFPTLMCIVTHPSLAMQSQCGHVDVLEHLIAEKADVNLCLVSGASPLYTAAFRVCSFCGPMRFRSSFLCTQPNAPAQGHKEIVDILLQNDADVNKAKKDGATALFAAAQQ